MLRTVPDIYSHNKISINSFDIFLSCNTHFCFLPLDYFKSERKALSRALPPLVVLCTLYWAFCLLYLSFKRKIKDLCSISSDNLHSPFHQNLTVAKCRECAISCCLCPQVDGISSHHKGHGIYTLGCSLYRSNHFLCVLSSCVLFFDVVSTA